MGLPFKSVTLQHNGKDYVVQPSDVWGLIGTIETVIGHTKLAVATARICSSPRLFIASHREPCKTNMQRKNAPPARP